MAINFPSSPSDGEEYTDLNSGTWVYDLGTNSWTLTAGGSTSAFNFRGGHDFRQSTPPTAPIESGDMWIHDAPTGTIDAVYTGISGQIGNGQLVLWDGNSYVMVSGTVPGYPDVGDGEGGTLDIRYLKLGANAPAQTVATTNETNFRGNVVLGDADEITLDAADGSGDFAGEVTTTNSTFDVNDENGEGSRITPYGSIDLQRKAAGETAFRIFHKTTRNVVMYANGSTEFANAVTSGDSVGGSNLCFDAKSTGAILRGFNYDLTAGDSNNPSFGGFDRCTVLIQNNGTADFTGEITSTISTFDIFDANGEGARITPYGSIDLQRQSGTQPAIRIFEKDSPKVEILANGYAEFAGTVTENATITRSVVIETEPDNNANYTTTTETYEEQEEVTPYIPAVPATYDEYGNELTAEVPAVEATYQTVTKTREIRTYTGPTLDVKERLQNLIARVDAIEADEVSDDATSSALLTLVASLSARIDALEAAS